MLKALYKEVPLGVSGLVFTREMSRWFSFGSSGDVKMVWFCHSGDVKRFGYDTREVSRWFGFGDSGDVNMVWF